MRSLPQGRRLAASLTFVLVAGCSTPVFADLIDDEPPNPPEAIPTGDDPWPAAPEKSCAVNRHGDAISSVAALALLLSGAALRRRGRSDVQPVCA